jgi:hypothetical protein
MPKIGKVQANFTGQTEVFELWYSQKEKFNVKGLPKKFLELMREEFLPFGFETERLLTDTLFHAVNKYKELIKKERKVILYKIEASTMLTMNKEPFRPGVGECYSGIKKGISKRIRTTNFGSAEAAIGLEYIIAIEIDNGNKKYHPIAEDGSVGYAMNSHGRIEYDVMEWSEQREAFFVALYESMQKLVFGISAFFSGNDIDLVNKIDNAGGNIKLLS